MRATTPMGSRTEKLTTSGPIGIERALHLGDQPGEEVELRGGDHRIARHLAHRIAAVGRVDQRQLAGVLRAAAAAMRRRIRRARAAATARHSAKPRCAAATAASTSAWHRRPRLAPSDSPVLGFNVSANRRMRARATRRRNRALRWSGAAARSLRRGIEACHRVIRSPPRRPISALAPIASTNSTISSAYIRGMSKVAYAWMIR